ncbi:hypothetical protein K438DRAFT_379823 [Mycena galopus ATCC 62051]|nr:hypothetical protein K438DRAFT_379823 [Mycena galopus ATCC 62051]
MSQPTAPSPILPALPKLDNSLGALFIGLVLSTALWGVGCAQAFWFYDSFRGEKMLLKTLVAASWILDTVQQAMIAHVVYTYTITNYFNPFFLDHYLWSLSIQSLFECLTAFLVQSFFLYRIWILCHNRYFVMIIPTLLVLAKLAIGIMYVVLNARETSISKAVADNLWASKAVNAATMASDVALAGCMVFLLAGAKSGMKQTDTLINKLLLFTVNTGLITSVCAAITLILAVKFPSNYLYGIFYFLTGKLYFNTMLASLNSRNPSKTPGTVIMMSGMTQSTAEPDMSIAFASPDGSTTIGSVRYWSNHVRGR